MGVIALPLSWMIAQAQDFGSEKFKKCDSAAIQCDPEMAPGKDPKNDALCHDRFWSCQNVGSVPLHYGPEDLRLVERAFQLMAERGKQPIEQLKAWHAPGLIRLPDMTCIEFLGDYALDNTSFRPYFCLMAGKQKHPPSGKNPSGDLTLIQIAQRFSTEESARDYFEKLRWPHGPVCPHCGNADKARVYKVTPNPEKKIRAGLYKCAECLQGFTVTVGTVCEDSHIPLNKWLIAFYMMCASKTQVSALQLQRQLEIGSYRSAWHLCHRIRFALQDIMPTDKLDGTVEADETYIGGVKRGMGRRYTGNKTAVVSLVERGGRVRSQVVEKVTGDALGRLLKQHIAESAHLNTDEAPVYKKPGKTFASHDVVNHSNEEYARRDISGRLATTNTAEGFFGNSKRSLDGTHHQVSAKHLPLYLAELDYKYNTRRESDGARTAAAIPKIVGKRLMLRRPKGRA